jgi:hypothetical protein
VIHGDNIQKNKVGILPELSNKCDSLLREVVNLIVSDKGYVELFDGPKDAFEQFFQAKLFEIK